MSIDYNQLFEQDAFKTIEPEKIELFKQFILKVQGKGFNEVLGEFMNFYNKMPKGKTLTNSEREALISTIYAVLPDSEKDRFNMAVRLMKNM